jgi:hypothetical protein
VAAQDLPRAQRIPEAYGEWDIVLDRGEFRFTHVSDRAHWIADGTLRVSGDGMTWTVADAADMGPNGAPDGLPLQRGQTLSLRWRRQSAALALVTDRSTPTLAALAARPLARLSDAPSRQRLENPAALEGSWAGTATASDVIARHDDPSSIADNTGPLRLTVHHGRFRVTQRTPNGPHWAVGTCVFRGDTLELRQARTDDNLSPAPLFFHWSVYHDRLTLRAAPGFSPEAWAYEAWRRIG